MITLMVKLPVGVFFSFRLLLLLSFNCSSVPSLNKKLNSYTPFGSDLPIFIHIKHIVLVTGAKSHQK